MGLLPCSPLNFNHIQLRQGTGTADHLTLLRLLLTYVFNLHIPDRAYFAIFVFFRHVLLLMINTASELLYMLI